VSADPDLRNDVVKMMQWAQVKLIELGATTELCDIGSQVKYLFYSFNFALKVTL
jgi:nonspecific dipeptidase